jgi:hypothetical protein
LYPHLDIGRVHKNATQEGKRAETFWSECWEEQ